MILQIAMEWTNDHLYEFDIRKKRFGDPSLGFGVMDDEKVFLAQLELKARNKFSYTYDFGDNWRLEILVEKTLKREAGKDYPVCLDGEQAAPPEDSGGVWGYGDMLDILEDPSSEEYGETVDWLGEGYDPTKFDLDGINTRLKRLYADLALENRALKDLIDRKL
jgi:hypothetical protein